MYKQDLVDAIQLGLRRGYYQNRQFGNEWEGFDNKMIEYLLTVFVAIEVSDFNNYGQLCKIKLEYPLWMFYNNAFPESIWTNENDLFLASELLERKAPEDKSRKRIDIGIVYEEHKATSTHIRSLHGIELKAIKQYYTEIKKDLDRLVGSMITTDSGTGEPSSISSCYSAFIKAYGLEPVMMTSTELAARKTAIVVEIDNILKVYRVKYPTLNFEAHTESIDHESQESYLERYSGIPDIEVTAYDLEHLTGEVLGVVIEISRKP
jgi:hypothetical protein